MAQKIADRVRETTTTTGTGSIALAGAVTGYRSFSSVLSTGDTTYYCVADQGGANWEVGIGTFTSPSTLARTTILSSSNAGSVVTFGAGTKDVFITEPSSQVLLASGATMTGPLLVNSAGAGNVARVAGAAASSAVVIGVDSTSADTNVNITIGNPKGTGYISALTADSTATGGNARGSYAVDWQLSRTSATQVASGTNSAIVGGANNIGSGNYSLSAGLSNQASATYTVALGHGTVANGGASLATGQYSSAHGIYAARVHAGNNITTVGDAQTGDYALSGRSTGGIAVRLTADGNTAASTNTANIPLNTAWMGTLGVVAREVNTGNCCYWQIRFGLGVQGSAGSTTYAEGTVEFQNIIGSTPVVTNLTRTADTSNRGLNLTFSPPVSSAIAVSGSSSTITGTAMVLNSVVSGTVAIGQSVSGTGVTAGTYITAGSGLNWTVSPSQTVTATTFSMYSTWDLAATIRTTEVQ